MLASYSRAAAAGQVPGRAELLRRHPELTEELEAFFDRVPSPARRGDDGERTIVWLDDVVRCAIA
jgi:hypothetical protein